VGFRPKKCGVGRLRVGLVCGSGAGWKCAGAGAGKISQIPAGADKKFQPVQDSSINFR